VHACVLIAVEEKFPEKRMMGFGSQTARGLRDSGRRAKTRASGRDIKTAAPSLPHRPSTSAASPSSRNVRRPTLPSSGSQSARRPTTTMLSSPRVAMTAKSPLSSVGHHSTAATSLAAIQLSSLSSLYRDEPDEDEDDEDRALMDQRAQFAARRRAYEREIASTTTTNTALTLPSPRNSGGSRGSGSSRGRLVRREVRIAEAQAEAKRKNEEAATWLIEEQKLEQRVRERHDEIEARRAKKLVRKIEYVSLSPFRQQGQPIFQQLPADHFLPLRDAHQQSLGMSHDPTIVSILRPLILCLMF
jgi:hypothetical protein